VDDDLIARADALDREILAIPADKVFTKRMVVTGFVVVMSILVIGFTGMYFSLRHITASTNAAVTQEIPGLKDQIDDRDATIVDLEDVNRQAIDQVVRLATEMQQHGLDPGQIEIRPTTTTTEP
jgi:uncharacterized iron-regulated membrane protein